MRLRGEVTSKVSMVNNELKESSTDKDLAGTAKKVIRQPESGEFFLSYECIRSSIASKMSL